ncbi:hypothetical protein Hte_008538 [Hypoxylon texense]
MAPTQQFKESIRESTLTFGTRYAVLNLDFMTVLMDSIKDTAEGRAFISNWSLWNDADAPFGKLVRGFGPFTADSAEVQIASRFTVDEKDVILRKTRWCAGAGNDLEQVLSAQDIDAVIVSTDCSTLTTTSTVISDNVLDLPLGRNQEPSDAMLNILVSKMDPEVILIGEALEMLEQS